MDAYPTALDLTKKLISLASYVSPGHDETPLTDFLAALLKEAFPEMTVEKQYLAQSKRCNLILKGNGQPKLFVIGHLDTVQPKAAWSTDPLQPTIIDKKLYGLGAADMKASLATFLWALWKEKGTIPLDAVQVLMYVDEEYDFEGVKRYLADPISPDFAPKMTLSLDGALGVSTGCRGLIELNLKIKGVSGHAANPANGVNAITETVAAFQSVSEVLKKYHDDALGGTTTNVSYMHGGVLQKNQDGSEDWLREGNVIADTAEVIFEVRSSVNDVTATLVLETIQHFLEKHGLKLSDSNIRHDIAPWPVVYDPASLAILKESYAAAKVPFAPSSRKLQGYIDAQMVVEKIPVPTFIIGTGGENKHGANENVPLVNIEQAKDVYTALLHSIL